MTIKTAKTAVAVAMLAAALTGAGCASEDYARPSQDAYMSDPHYAGYGYYADQCQRVKQNRNVAGTIIGAVAGVLLGLRRGLDVGADAAEPEQVGGGLEDGVHQLGGRGLGLVEAEGGAGLGREGDGFEAARENAAAGRDQSAVVVVPA